MTEAQRDVKEESGLMGFRIDSHESISSARNSEGVKI